MNIRGPIIVVGLAMAMLSANCHTTTKPVAPAIAKRPAMNQELGDIVAALRANDDALKNFRAALTFTLESPKLKSVQRFPSGTVAYRRPADLFVVGKNKLNATLFRLTSHGNEFLIEFPMVENVDDRYYYSFEGEKFAKVPFTVSPADVARELFMPVDWNGVSQDDVSISDGASGQKAVKIKLQNGLTRQLAVQGTPWEVIQNTLTDHDGATLCDTTMRNYVESGGVRLPSIVDASFPNEHTRLTFELRNIRVNLEPNSKDFPDALFEIQWRPGQ